MRKSWLALVTLVAFMTSLMSCSLINTEQLFAPMPAENYLNNVKPVFDILFLAYSADLEEDEKEVFQNVIAELDRQAVETGEVRVMEGLIVVGLKVLEKEVEVDVSLDPKEYALALVGLHLLKQSYSEVEEFQWILPILEKILQGSQAEVTIKAVS